MKDMPTRAINLLTNKGINFKSAAPIESLKVLDTGIVDSGATHIYITINARHSLPNLYTATLHVGTTNGHTERFVADASLPIPQVSNDFPTTGRIMASFKHTLIGVGRIWDTNCTVTFSKTSITVFSPTGQPILIGWRGKHLPRL